MRFIIGIALTGTLVGSVQAQDFAGTYAAPFYDDTVTLTLQQDEFGSVWGTLSDGGAELTLQGEVHGERVRGIIFGHGLVRPLTFEAWLPTVRPGSYVSCGGQEGSREEPSRPGLLCVTYEDRITFPRGGEAEADSDSARKLVAGRYTLVDDALHRFTLVLEQDNGVVWGTLSGSGARFKLFGSYRRDTPCGAGVKGHLYQAEVEPDTTPVPGPTAPLRPNFCLTYAYPDQLPFVIQGHVPFSAVESR